MIKALWHNLVSIFKDRLQILAIIILVFGVLVRLLPHPPNFAPIAAIAIFAGTYLDKRLALWLPVLAMLISDLFLGFYFWPVMVSVYACFMISGLIGIWIRKKKAPNTVIFGTLASSFIFFFVTNFMVFIATPFYPKTLAGFSQCFLMAIPFFRNTLLGDLFYVGLFFGVYELVFYLVRKRKTALSLEKIKDN